MTMPETRKPRDHLEVRCARSHKLIGWLTGIEAKNVPHAPLLLADPADIMVIEDEDGVVEENGFSVELETCEIVQDFDDYQSHEALNEIYRWVPSYAARTRLGAAARVRYTWVAVLADPEEQETLFDFDNFEPWGEQDKRLVAAELEFHATQLLADAKSHLKGSWVKQAFNGAQSGFSGYVLDELDNIEESISAIPWTSALPGSRVHTTRTFDLTKLPGWSRS